MDDAQACGNAGVHDRNPVLQTGAVSEDSQRRRSDRGRHPRGRRNSFRLGSRDARSESSTARHTCSRVAMPRMETGGLGLATNQPSRPRDASERHPSERHQGAKRRGAISRARGLRSCNSRRLGSRFELGGGAERERVAASARGDLASPESRARASLAARARDEGGDAPAASWGQSPPVACGGDAWTAGPWGQARQSRFPALASSWTLRPRWGVLRFRLKHSGHRARVDSRAAPGKMREHEVAPHALVLFRGHAPAPERERRLKRERERALTSQRGRALGSQRGRAPASARARTPFTRTRRGSDPAGARAAACGSCTRATPTGA
jgi:hypothetical protein